MSKTIPLHANGHRVTGRRPGRPKDAVDVLYTDAGHPMLLTHLFSCAGCGEYFSPRLETDGAHIDTPCPVPDGLTTVTRLNVPSGKIIVTDDLRPVYDGFNHDGFASYNSILGVSQVIQAYAEQGCAFGYVGNTCPGLYPTGPEEYVIATPEYTDDDEIVGELAGTKELAGVCTDLWAYSIADYAHWKARGGKDSDLGWSDSVVEIPAGTYEFTYHGGEKGFDKDAFDTVIFTHIKKVV